jgi:DNA-binding IclR family transcriptional regulator
MDLHAIALPIMREINNLCGEGVYLNILNRNERMCLGFIQCNHSITAMIEIGQRSPLYAGASSKVMLAFLPESRIEALINSTELLPLTKSTITCRDALRKELAEIRRNRYAVSKEERIVGAGSVSVPVFNAAGEVNASISVLLPLLRWDDNKVNEIIEILVDGGRRVSRQIGHKV